MTSPRAILDALPPLSDVDFAQFGEIEVAAVGRWQRIGARYLARNWVTIPHVTHHDELDITALEKYRNAWNAGRSTRITLLPFIVAATVEALRQYPQFNASLDGSGDNLVLKKYFHIGVAVDTPKGVLVPVIRRCDSKGVEAIASELSRFAEKARTHGLSMAEMSGGCFTISSLGHIGGTAFTPIINAPELAILGVCRVQQRLALSTDGTILQRPILPVSLSYDHRVINGVDAARFTQSLQHILSAPTFYAHMTTSEAKQTP